MNITFCIATILAAVLTFGDPAFLSRSRMNDSTPASCSTLKDSNIDTTGHVAQPIGNIVDNFYRFTKFTPASTYDVCQIEFLIGKAGTTGTPIGNIVAQVWSDSSNPSSLLSTSDSINITTLPTKGTSNYVAFTFSSPASLTSGVTYWIGLVATNVDINSYVGWWRPNPFVAGGTVISSNGINWTAGSSVRGNFKTYSE